MLLPLSLRSNQDFIVGLLRTIIRDGKLTEALPSLEVVREAAAAKFAQLPSGFKDIYKKRSVKAGYTKTIARLAPPMAEARGRVKCPRKTIHSI